MCSGTYSHAIITSQWSRKKSCIAGATNRVMGVALIIEFCDHNIPFSIDLCIERLIHNENCKTAYIKGHALSGGGGGGGGGGGQWPPWPYIFL